MACRAATCNWIGAKAQTGGPTAREARLRVELRSRHPAAGPCFSRRAEAESSWRLVLDTPLHSTPLSTSLSPLHSPLHPSLSTPFHSPLHSFPFHGTAAAGHPAGPRSRHVAPVTRNCRICRKRRAANESLLQGSLALPDFSSKGLHLCYKRRVVCKSDLSCADAMAVATPPNKLKQLQRSGQRVPQQLLQQRASSCFAS